MKKQVKREVVFEAPLDMYLAIRGWERATENIAANIVGEHYTEECVARAMIYWLDPKARRWEKEFYNGFNGFKKSYFTKVRNICKDMLRSPDCGGKTVKYLKIFNRETGMLEEPEGFQGSDILVDETTLPKYLMLQRIIEEIRESLNKDRDRQIFDMMVGGLSNKEIAEKIGVGEKTIRNQKSALLNLIRENYKSGVYVFKIGHYTALDRQEGSTYYNVFFSNFTENNT